MKAYFYNKSLTKNVIYVPGTFVILGDEEGIDIDYKLNNTNVFDAICASGNTLEKRKILGDALTCLEINIDDSFIESFNAYSFGGSDEDTVFAHFCADYLGFICWGYGLHDCDNMDF